MRIVIAMLIAVMVAACASNAQSKDRISQKNGEIILQAQSLILEKNDNAGAEAILRDALETRDLSEYERGIVLETYAMSLFQTQQYRASIDAFQKALDLTPNTNAAKRAQFEERIAGIESLIERQDSASESDPKPEPLRGSFAIDPKMPATSTE